MGSINAKKVGEDVSPVIAKLRSIPITSSIYWDFIDSVIKKGNREDMYELLEEADRIISELQHYMPETKPEKKYFRSKQPSEDRRNINLSLRYFILRRDNSHCKLCGLGVEDGIKLHVDHIIPFSKGGKTREDNLRTLCASCNMGKKDTYEN